MENPLINIIVRTKDRLHLLLEALQSIANQCYRPVKPVIVNDGGEHIDDSTIISVLKDIPFVYVQHEQNMGRSAALNSGLKNSDGAFIYFLDDDDLVYKDGISYLIDASLKNGNIPVYGKVICTDGAVQIKELGEPFNYGKLVFENYIATNSLLVPFKIVQAVGLFDESFEIFEDWDWILRMACLSKPFFKDCVIAEYRTFESSTLTGKGGLEYHKKYKKMLLEKHSKKITPALILEHVQSSVDTAVLEKERIASAHKDLSLKFATESKHYFNETVVLKSEIECYKADILSHKLEMGRYEDELGNHKKEVAKYQKELEKYKIELDRHKEHVKWQQANISRLEDESVNYKALVQSNRYRFVTLELELENSRRQYESSREQYEKSIFQNDNLSKCNLQLSDINRKLSEELQKIRKELLFYQLPPVDIIIVNYNGLSYLPSCLETLFASEYPDFSVIVVDNNSADGSVNWIETNYPEITVIQNKTNEGFGKANLKGIKYGKSPFFALLNNDTKVDSNWLPPLVEVMQKEPLCAAACSRLMFMDKPEVINAAGGGMNFVGYGYDHDIFSIAPPACSNSPDSSAALSSADSSELFVSRLSTVLSTSLASFSSDTYGIKDVFFPTAAACLVRRSAFDDIGGFDNSFFMYHEDVDLGWRFHLRGYSVKYIPESVVFHAFGGTSLKSGSMHFRNRLGLRHALRSLMKNYEINTLKRVLPIFFQLGINNFRAGIPTGFFRAIFWNLVMMPDTIINRARVQRSRKQTDSELSSLIWQDVYLPVQFPDYQIHNMDSFIKNYKNSRSDSNHENLNGSKLDDNNVIELINSPNCHLGYGWHSCEVYFGDGHTLYRWTRERAQFFFWHSGGDAVLRLKVLGLSGLLGSKRGFIVDVRCKEIDKYSFPAKQKFVVESDQWEYFEIPFSGSEGAVQVLISVSDTWSPHEKFNNRDYRRLGIGIASAVLLTSCKPGFSLDFIG